VGKSSEESSGVEYLSCTRRPSSHFLVQPIMRERLLGFSYGGIAIISTTTIMAQQLEIRHWSSQCEVSGFA
jgi:hypothetical protein